MGRRSLVRNMETRSKRNLDIKMCPYMGAGGFAHDIRNAGLYAMRLSVTLWPPLAVQGSCSSWFVVVSGRNYGLLNSLWQYECKQSNVVVAFLFGVVHASRGRDGGWMVFAARAVHLPIQSRRTSHFSWKRSMKCGIRSSHRLSNLTLPTTTHGTFYSTLCHTWNTILLLLLLLLFGFCVRYPWTSWEADICARASPTRA